MAMSAEQTSKRLIHAVGIVKEFGHGEARIRVLNEIDLDIFAGDTTFIVGESGSGKTTLISVLSAILTPEGGTVEVLGRMLTRQSVASLSAFRRDSIGFVFQQFNLLPTLTAVENASIPLLAAGVTRSHAELRAFDLLRRLGLESQANKTPNEMSGGQQQRVAIARALVHNPRIVVCDEPTASLDAKSGSAVMELLHEVAVHPDRAVVIVTHDTRIYHFANRIVRLEDGRITSDRRGLFPEHD
jgi:putative ABC transport system ATP-binding protein